MSPEQKTYYTSMALIAATQTADFLTTVTAINQGGIEINPLVNAFMKNGGPTGVLTFKMLGTLGFIYSSEYFRIKDGVQCAIGVNRFVNITYSMISFWNIVGNKLWLQN